MTGAVLLVTLMPKGDSFKGMKALLEWDKLRGVPDPHNKGGLVKPMTAQGITGEIDEADLAEAKTLATVTIHERRDSASIAVSEMALAGDAKEELVDALKLLLNHYETDIPPASDERVGRAKLIIANTVTAYAMGKFVERLVVDGYVVVERAEELLERSRNHTANRGFVTNATLAEREPPPPKSEEQEIEDLLR